MLIIYVLKWTIEELFLLATIGLMLQVTKQRFIILFFLLWIKGSKVQYHPHIDPEQGGVLTQNSLEWITLRAWGARSAAHLFPTLFHLYLLVTKLLKTYPSIVVFSTSHEICRNWIHYYNFQRLTWIWFRSFSIVASVALFVEQIFFAASSLQSIEQIYDQSALVEV